VVGIRSLELNVTIMHARKGVESCWHNWRKPTNEIGMPQKLFMLTQQDCLVVG